MLHGQCVALGSAGAAYLSAKRGELPREAAEDVWTTLRRFGLPVSLSNSGLDEREILEATKNDKKMDSGTIKFVLLHTIGDAFVDRTVTDEEILDTLRWLSGGIYE